MNEEIQQEVPRLKPVIFFGNQIGRRYHQNAFQQNLLLKALAVTQDPKQLAQMAGFNRVADVYRTLDKMMIRREYHDAMIRAGVDPDFLVRNLKDIAMSAGKDGDRLGALKALLKSLGLDQYKETAISGGSGWEEAVLKKNEEQRALGGPEDSEEYDVQVPELPDSVKKSHAEEADTLRGMYE